MIKEDNRVSEQAFGVVMTFGDPVADINAATLQQEGQFEGFDYIVGNPGDILLTIIFTPDSSEATFTFFIFSDGLAEGTEGFRITVASHGLVFPDFALPSAEEPAPYPYTLIRIKDDGECYLMHHHPLLGILMACCYLLSG